MVVQTRSQKNAQHTRDVVDKFMSAVLLARLQTTHNVGIEFNDQHGDEHNYYIPAAGARCPLVQTLAIFFEHDKSKAAGVWASQKANVKQYLAANGMRLFEDSDKCEFADRAQLIFVIMAINHPRLHCIQVALVQFATQ